MIPRPGKLIEIRTLEPGDLVVSCISHVKLIIASDEVTTATFLAEPFCDDHPELISVTMGYVEGTMVNER